ncbi:MAG: cellulase family glycosylhydrolase [Ruminiclostridium sp.]|nr:cellulase family glycosylhydrolase [Ruminiclostridium sp.]
MKQKIRKIAAIISTLFITYSFCSCSQASENARVYIEGTKFMAGGNELWINGVNTPWKNWNDFTGSMIEGTWSGDLNIRFWDEEFARLVSDGINCTRIWINCEGEGIVSLTENGEIQGINENHWDDLDKLFELAEKNKLYLMPTLLSFDHFKDTTGFGSGTRWRKLIVSKENTNAYAETYVKEFCERYKDNEYIFAIDIMNEPDWVFENEECGQIDWDHLSYFFGKCASVIHENSDFLVTVGMGIIKYNSDKYEGNKVSDEYLAELTGLENSYLDFYSTHYYNWQKPWFGFPCDKSPKEFGIAEEKPCLIGETHNDDEAEIGMSLTEKYKSVYENGWNGIMVWMQFTDEDYVWYGYDYTREATSAMAEYIPEKIRPLENAD